MAQPAARTEAVKQAQAVVASQAEWGWFRWLLFGPTLIFLAAMTLFPLFYSLGVSLFRFAIGSPPRFVGLGNYVALVTHPEFMSVTRVTLEVTVAAVSIEIVLGMLLGFALHQRLPAIGVIRLVVFLPMMLAPLVVGLFWRFLLDQTFGLVNYLVGVLGGRPVPWLIHPTYALASVILVDVWQWTPFVILLVVAGLGNVPHDLLEAAALDRASLGMRMRHIYWPYLRFPLLLAVLFRSIDTLKMFDVPFILTGGGPGNFTTTLSLLGYRYHFQFFQVSMAAAISWLIVILINVVANVLVNFLTPRRPLEQVHTGL